MQMYSCFTYFSVESRLKAAALLWDVFMVDRRRSFINVDSNAIRVCPMGAVAIFDGHPTALADCGSCSYYAIALGEEAARVHNSDDCKPFKDFINDWDNGKIATENLAAAMGVA